MFSLRWLTKIYKYGAGHIQITLYKWPMAIKDNYEETVNLLRNLFFLFFVAWCALFRATSAFLMKEQPSE